MNVLVVPMFALSRMGGPWSRAQAISAALERSGCHVVLAVAEDGNCVSPCVTDTCQLPVPSPLGLPMAIASRSFPIAEKLGISGRKPVRSFEEVLWLTGALAYRYERESVDALCDAIEQWNIDVVYSEYSLPAIIAARALGIPVFGSFSYTTQTSFASDRAKAGGVCKLLQEIGLPPVESSLQLFDWLDRRFVPSCRELEPFEREDVEFVGFLREIPELDDTARDCIVVYLGAGSVSQREVERTIMGAFAECDVNVYVAGCKVERQEGNVRFAPRFDFSQLLSRARCFVHHGGQNSTMDAFAYGVPQVVVPGHVFERLYNAEGVERVGAGVKLELFGSEGLRDACRRVSEDSSFVAATQVIRQSLVAGGGAAHIASRVLSL